MKKILLIMIVCSFAAVTFAQEKSNTISEKAQNESLENEKIQKISKVNQTNATNTTVSYDFTTGSDKYYGGAAAAIEVEPGVWAMIAGNAVYDGTTVDAVDAADRNETWNNRNAVNVYHLSDVNLDGNIDAADRNITWNNRNKTTQVP